jgi:hypothetical protein
MELIGQFLNQIQVQTWSSACGKTPDPELNLVYNGLSNNTNGKDLDP